MTPLRGKVISSATTSHMVRPLVYIAALLVIASMGALAALPAVLMEGRYYTIGLGLTVSVVTPAGRALSFYPPMAVPEVLLTAAVIFALRGRRAGAAYLSLAALSYYIVVALEIVHGFRPLAGGLGVPYGRYMYLVAYGGHALIYLPPLALLTVTSGATLMASIWPEVRRALEAAEELARRRFGVSLDTLRRLSPGIAEAVETYARFAPGHGASSRSYLLEARRRRLRDLADAEARRRFGVSLEELERTRPWAARALLEMARYLPEAGGGGKGEGKS
ncbi:MAG: hypothetical protein GU352_02915 [Acidilobus sp.]|nr:hypothetical protein [Acidilobus sp.]